MAAMIFHLGLATLGALFLPSVVESSLAQDQPVDSLPAIFAEIRSMIDSEKLDAAKSAELGDLAELEARAGRGSRARETFQTFLRSLQGRSHARVRDQIRIEIAALLKMSVAAQSAGDHGESTQYLRSAFDRAMSGPSEEKSKIDLAEVMYRANEFGQVIETALYLGNHGMAEEVFGRANETIVALPADETDRLGARVGLSLTRARAQLDSGQEQSARTSIRSILSEFDEYLDAWPCHHQPRLGVIQAELGSFEKAAQGMYRCFSVRDQILDGSSKESTLYHEVARYRFYKARDLASLGRATWKAGDRSRANEWFDEALSLCRTTPFDDQFYYWRQLIPGAAEMGRIEVIEEAVAKGYQEDDWAIDWYPDVMRRLLTNDRNDLISKLNGSHRGPLLRVQVERGDYRGALKTGEGVGFNETPSSGLVRSLAQAYAGINGVQEAIKWSASWEKTWVHIDGLMGIADYIIRVQRVQTM